MIARLMAPVIILIKLSNNPQGALIVAIITVLLSFTLVLALVLMLFTRARRHEILASARAYVPPFHTKTLPKQMSLTETLLLIALSYQESRES